MKTHPLKHYGEPFDKQKGESDKRFKNFLDETVIFS